MNSHRGNEVRQLEIHTSVSHRLLAAQTRFNPGLADVVFVVDTLGDKTGFSLTNFASSVGIISPMLYTRLHLYGVLIRRKNG